MFKSLAVFAAAFALAVGAAFTAVSVAPGAQVPARELIQKPVPMDGCLCGGNGLTWHFVTREENGAFDKCWYDVRNGGVHAYYVVYDVSSSQPCPNLS